MAQSAPLRLTAQQRRVIDLRLEGMGRREIAHRLGISILTVRDHLDAARAANEMADELELLITVDRETR